jgi:GDP/GTP exchange factor required for growth at low temperature
LGALISKLLTKTRLKYLFFWQKCFQLNNFSSLVAIVAGLRSDWVSRAMKRGWDRVNVYKLRILKDLTSFAESTDDFKHIRRAVTQLTDPKLAAGASEEASSVRSSTRGKLTDGRPPTGVPFLGVFSFPTYQTYLFSNSNDKSLLRRNLPCTASASQPPAGPD